MSFSKLFDFVKDNTTKTFLITLILIVIIKGLLFLIIIPANEIPDELRYHKNMHHLASGKIPYFNDFSETGHPVLYETLMLPFFLAGKAIGGDNLTFLIIRLISTIFFAVTVFVCYLTTKIIFPNNLSVQVLAPSLLALNPQVGFMSSALSPESLLNLLFSVFIFLLVKLIAEKLDYKTLGYLVLIIAFGLLIKERFLISVPLFLIAISLRLFQNKSKSLRKATALLYHLDFKKDFLKASLTTVFTAISVVAFYFLSKFLIIYFSHAYIATPHKEFHAYSFTLKIFKQFWGSFGWLQLPLAQPVYLALAVFCLAIIGGLSIFAITIFRKEFDLRQNNSLFLLVLAVIFTLIATFSYEWRTGTSQGRYLFIAISPISILMALGFAEVFRKRFLYIAQPLVFTALSALNIYSLIWLIFPFYY